MQLHIQQCPTIYFIVQIFESKCLAHRDAVGFEDSTLQLKAYMSFLELVSTRGESFFSCWT